MRITIEIGPSKRGIGGAEAFGMGMIVPFLIDTLLGLFSPAPAPRPACCARAEFGDGEHDPLCRAAMPDVRPVVDGLHRMIAMAMAAHKPQPDGGRLAAFMEEIMKDLKPTERDILRRRFTGERAPTPPPPPPPAAPPTGGAQ